MNIEIVTIGDELLLGYTIDTNGAHLARELAAIGVEVVRRTSVRDDAGEIASVVRDALERTGAVITTGGLGPTSDDMTKPSIAALFGRELRVDEGLLTQLEARWRARFDRPLPASNLQQVAIPDGATVLPNAHGSAPGIWIEDERGRWVAILPGVPREMRGMLADALMPRLRERLSAAGGVPKVVRSRTLRTTAIAESALADRLGDVAPALGGLTLAFLPGQEGVDLRLTARGMTADDADAALAHGLALLRDRIGTHVYGEGSVDLASVVLDRCRAANQTIATAESCTGGLLGARLTAIAGSSDVVLGGVIAYANEVKIDQLGVAEHDLATAGAVSEPVARQMARGARERFGATIAIAITGVAGPGGGSLEKPVGTVWIAVDAEGREPVAHRSVFIGDRSEIRYRSAQFALELVRRLLETAVT